MTNFVIKIQELPSHPPHVLAAGFCSAAGAPGVSGQHWDMAASRDGLLRAPVLAVHAYGEGGILCSLFNKDPPAINFSLLANKQELPLEKKP